MLGWVYKFWVIEVLLGANNFKALLCAFNRIVGTPSSCCEVAKMSFTWILKTLPSPSLFTLSIHFALTLLHFLFGVVSMPSPFVPLVSVCTVVVMFYYVVVSVSSLFVGFSRFHGWWRLKICINHMDCQSLWFIWIANPYNCFYFKYII